MRGRRWARAHVRVVPRRRQRRVPTRMLAPRPGESDKCRPVTDDRALSYRSDAAGWFADALASWPCRCWDSPGRPGQKSVEPQARVPTRLLSRRDAASLSASCASAQLSPGHRPQ